MIKFKKLTETAVIPARGSAEAAGLDLYADERVEVAYGAIAVASTGVAVALEPGTVGLVKPRSGLAVREGIDVLAGVVDSDYRGEVKVVLTRLKPGVSVFQRGDRIAQLVIQRVVMDEPIEVLEMDDTRRGEDGFGSTGK